jgi:hypothetical protein
MIYESKIGKFSKIKESALKTPKMPLYDSSHRGKKKADTGSALNFFAG